MSAIFLQGSALSVLRGLPGDFFHCAVTSPPYFGLRVYDGGQEIWDGAEGCEHEWVGTVKVDRRGVEGTGLVGRDPYKGGEARVDKVAGICSKCSAWKGQLGAEPTPELYISHLIQICGEVKRVLRPDGVFWLNIGDSWVGSTSQHYGGKSQGFNSVIAEGTYEAVPDTGRGERVRNAVASGVPSLNMVLIPSLLALVLRADGWYVRSMVVWEKKNPMPESVNGWRWEQHRVKVSRSARASLDAYHTTAYGDSPMGARDGRDFADHSKEWRDCPGCPKCLPNDGYVLRKGSWRPTDSYEFILMLTKTGNYYCDREAVLETVTESTVKRVALMDGREDYDRSSDGYKRGQGAVADRGGVDGLVCRPSSNGGRNLRSVWSFPTKPFPGAHFAVFPTRLPELCIKSSTSEKGCCPKCGAPWARVIEKGLTAHDGDTGCNYPVGSTANRLALLQQAARERGSEYSNSSNTVGWRPTCSCDAGDPISCRVLDPFSGAGTTALVAEQLGLDPVSIDTSAEYIQMSRDRLVVDEQKRIDEFIKRARNSAKNNQRSTPLPS